MKRWLRFEWLRWIRWNNNNPVLAHANLLPLAATLHCVSWYCWTYTNIALVTETLRSQMLYISGCIAIAWETLHTESSNGYKSRTDALVMLSPKPLQLHPVFILWWHSPCCYTEASPLHTHHFHPSTRPYRIPAKWMERQMNLMWQRATVRVKVEGQKMSAHLSTVKTLMLSQLREAIWVCIHMLTSFHVRKRNVRLIVRVCFLVSETRLKCWISITHRLLHSIGRYSFRVKFYWFRGMNLKNSLHMQLICISKYVLEHYFFLSA